MAGLGGHLRQEPPLEHDVFGDREDTLLEHRPHLVREPVIEFGAAAGVTDESCRPVSASVAELDIEEIERLRATRRGLCVLLGRRSSDRMLYRAATLHKETRARTWARV